MMVPKIESSTREERLAYVREAFQCIGNCELCGKCKILHHRHAEEVYADYIDGKRSFVEISIELRK